MSYFSKPFLEVIKPSYIVFILSGVVIDLITKYLVIQYYSIHDSQNVVGDLFRMTLTFNTGFVFGIAQNNMVLSLFTTGIAIVILTIYRLVNSEIGNPWGWNFVMIGAFGNFIDKFFVKIPPGGGVRFGFSPKTQGEFIGVVDFLDFDWPNFLFFDRWPAFNFADSCVSIGLVILLFTMNPKANTTSSTEQKK